MIETTLLTCISDYVGSYALRNKLNCCDRQELTRADVHSKRSEWLLGAQTVPWIFSLRALAASGMPREQEVRCRYAAEATVIHTGCSENQTSNSLVADEIETGQLRGYP